MRKLLLALCVLSSTGGAWAGPKFVRTSNTAFALDQKPYRFVGANFWPAMNLGSVGLGGDRGRLLRELDRLKAIGVINLRLFTLTEGPDTEPWRIVPSLQPVPGRFDERLLEGLDFTLVAMAERGMKAVLCLGNFWQWSGGFAQYVSWVEGSPIPYPTGGDWEGFQRYAARFYANRAAREIFKRAVRQIVLRTNSVTGAHYRTDPTIMAWELANEPRGVDRAEDFVDWVKDTSLLIKKLDPNHLVTTGSEGITDDPMWTQTRFAEIHKLSTIDYLTVHVWVENSGWYNPKLPETYQPALEKAVKYIEAHAKIAKHLGKPLVLEEFGLARDWGAFDARSGTWARDHFFKTMFDTAKNLGISGVAFWAWAGEAEPIQPGSNWQVGQPFTGDPPHERQGWYSVYAGDESTFQTWKGF